LSGTISLFKIFKSRQGKFFSEERGGAFEFKVSKKQKKMGLILE
jgi:hypothetical protein